MKISPDELKQFIYNWDMKFPIDYWWRHKYGIRFGSKDHLDANFVDMCLDFIETRDITNKQMSKADIKNQDMDDEEFSKFTYDNINLDDFIEKDIK